MRRIISNIFWIFCLLLMVSCKGKDDNTGKKVFNIGLGALFICLANKLTTDIAEGIGKWKQEVEPSTCRVIFKDTGFNDVEKTNSIQILKRYGINEVNTI